MPNKPKDLPLPIANPGEESGTASPRVVSSVQATTDPQPPQVKVVEGEQDSLFGGAGRRMSTEVERTASLIQKFGMLNVFAAVILVGGGGIIAYQMSANQHLMADALDRLDATARVAREDAKWREMQAREDATKQWTVHRELALAIRDQTRATEETHATMKKTAELMSIHASSMTKILKGLEKN